MIISDQRNGESVGRIFKTETTPINPLARQNYWIKFGVMYQRVEHRRKTILSLSLCLLSSTWESIAPDNLFVKSVPATTTQSSLKSPETPWRNRKLDQGSEKPRRRRRQRKKEKLIKRWRNSRKSFKSEACCGFRIWLWDEQNFVRGCDETSFKNHCPRYPAFRETVLSRCCACATWRGTVGHRLGFKLPTHVEARCDSIVYRVSWNLYQLDSFCIEIDISTNI